MKRIALLICCCVLFVPAGAARAVTLGVQGPGTVAVGSGFSVDLVLSDLGLNAAGGLNLVGAFEVGILYDPSQTAFVGYTLGGSLGDVDLFEALDWSWGDLGGVIDLAEESLLGEADLFGLQSGKTELLLATLEFECLGPGLSSIAVDEAYPLLVFGDAFGNPLAVDIFEGALIRQIPGGPAVPEPASILLLGGGLIGLGASRRRRRTSR